MDYGCVINKKMSNKKKKNKQTEENRYHKKVTVMSPLEWKTQ